MAKANKSNPFSIRVDLEKFDFVKKREKLDTGQQTVDFLLNKYWWENKLPHITAKEAPPLELKTMQDLTKPTNEIKPFEQPKTNFSIDNTNERGGFNQSNYKYHLSKIEKLVFADEKTEYMEVVRNDKSLSDKDQEKLITALKF